MVVQLFQSTFKYICPSPEVQWNKEVKAASPRSITVIGFNIISGWRMSTGRLSLLLLRLCKGHLSLPADGTALERNCKLHKKPLDICPTQKPQ